MTEMRMPFLSRSLFEIAIFSAVSNILLLVVPLYLLQIYDRVLPSLNMDTLLYLSFIAVFALSLLGILEVVRGLYANRIAARLHDKLGPAMFVAAMNGPKAGLGDIQPLRDLAGLRVFIASRIMFFVFDLPFAPLFVAILYFIHPLLFWITVGGAALLTAVAFLNQAISARNGSLAATAQLSAMNSAQSFARNFETVRALGMTSNAAGIWGNRSADSLIAADKAAAINAFCGGLARALRMMLQIAILGAGAFLILTSEMTAGMIFAASIISARALQPLDQIIGAWRPIIDAVGAWKRIAAAERGVSPGGVRSLELPAGTGALSFEDVVYFLPDSDAGKPPLIKRLSFRIEAGELVAIIGPSQAGKSTLARLVARAIDPQSGVVRFDGADIRGFDPDRLGRQIGYLAQDVELFPGTVAQNISRFDSGAAADEIVAAATNAHAHKLILGLRHGYSTNIGPTGARLSGGERQRIGLARAFYGNPKLVVLDEPNANLDADGEKALENALVDGRKRGTTIMIITHRPSIAAKCDRIMMLRDGRVEALGHAAEVLRRAHAMRESHGSEAATRPALAIVVKAEGAEAV